MNSNNQKTIIKIADSKYLDWKICLKNQLKMQINDLGLNSLVDLHGYVNNTLKYFKKSDVFAAIPFIPHPFKISTFIFLMGSTL